MAPLEVLPVQVAKDYLNIRTGQFDGELETFIAPAVERVERHLAGEAGIGTTLVTAEQCTASQLLAVKVVLGTYWETQRTRVVRGGYGGAPSAAAIEADSGPAGRAPLRFRLREILGVDEFVDGGGGQEARGVFPPPLPWPDPVQPCGWPG